MLRVIILLILAFIGSCASSENTSISLYGSSTEIRAYVLNFTPIGVKLKRVSKFIDEDLSFEKITSPPYMKSTGVRVRDIDDPQIITIAGEHSIKILVGTYRDPKRLFLLKTDVYLQWAFNEEDELIDVFVHKYTQPP